MKIALFGRKIDFSDLDKLLLLLRELQSEGDVEWVWYLPFYRMLSRKSPSLPSGSVFASHGELPEDTDLFLVLGGDGTLLEAVTLVRDRGIPVAGINFGRLGFLTTAYVEEGAEGIRECNRWIRRLLERNYEIRPRSLLRLQAGESLFPPDFYPYALNEITIQRTDPVMLEIEVRLDGRRLPTYRSDGLLIATATGSTAYSLSIGGPVVTPDARVLIIAPIAPHNLNVRPLIVPDTSVVELSYTGRRPAGILTADNRSVAFPQGRTLRVSKAGFELRSVSIDPNFIRALNRKLLWGEDRRNLYPDENVF